MTINKQKNTFKRKAMLSMIKIVVLKHLFIYIYIFHKIFTKKYRNSKKELLRSNTDEMYKVKEQAKL